MAWQLAERATALDVFTNRAGFQVRPDGTDVQSLMGEWFSIGYRAARSLIIRHFGRSTRSSPATHGDRTARSEVCMVHRVPASHARS